MPVASAVPLRVLWRQGNRQRAVVALGPRAGGRAGDHPDRPVVELNSVLGRVVLTAVQPIERVPVDGPSP
ncbi:MAG: hypothetical protein ABUS79_13420 [Pseudomonadota bacterium]